MDLRIYAPSAKQIKEAEQFISEGTFRYQPYIVSDRLEVGAGQKFHDGRSPGAGIFDGDFYAAEHVKIEKGKPVVDLDYFRKRNAETREIYDFAADKIVELLGGDISKKSFAEIGCNSGLHLFNLRKRGAAQCVGYEKNDYINLFRWLNDVTGLGVELQQGFWHNLEHRFLPEDLPEYDIMVSSHFINHMSDPLHFLAYMCDRAKEAVFIWTQMDPAAETFTVHFPTVTGRLQNQPFPLCLDSQVRLSEPALQISLKLLGFEDFIPIDCPLPSPGWQDFLGRFRMYFARRTQPTKSALDSNFRKIHNHSMHEYMKASKSKLFR